jgi:tripartite-type tricarboxylate transporter receptor subunit TctC
MNRRTVLRALLAAGALPAAASGRAQDASRSLLNLLVGFSAGSAPDVVARVVGKPLAETLRRTLVVDNRAGVAGQLALSALKQAPADASTIAITPLAPLTLYPSTYARLPYDPVADFTPICTIGLTDFAFVVAADHPARTVQEFVAWSRANPDQSNIGNPGNGSSPHFVAWTFAASAGLQVQHVPYRMPPQMAQEIVGGAVAGGIATSSLFSELVKGGKLRVLATSGTQRSGLYPQCPTFGEAGYAGAVAQEWYALFARAGLPTAELAAVAAAARHLAQQDVVRSTLASLGFAPQVHDAAWLTDQLRSETAHWRAVVSRVGFKAQ